MHLFNDMSLKAEFGGYFHFGDVSIASICLDGALVDEGTSSMDQLFDKGLVEVSEVDTSGMVGRVIVRNKSQSNLVVFDNDILRGAKQNRVSQATFVLGPGMQSPAPVFCVERSRWRFDGDRNFSSSALAMGPKTRGLKMKMLKESQHRAHVQDSVWNEVDELADKFSSYSRTADLENILEMQRFEAERELNDFIARSDCHGFVVVAGRRRFMEIFWSKEVCRKQMLKSVRSWLADAAMEAKAPPIGQVAMQDFLMSSQWVSASPVGIETAYQGDGELNGRATLLDDAMLHTFAEL